MSEETPKETKPKEILTTEQPPTTNVGEYKKIVMGRTKVHAHTAEEFMERDIRAAEALIEELIHRRDLAGVY